MKKSFFILAFLSIFLMGTALRSTACTNILVTKGASADGSTMITYAADSHFLYGELYFWPAAVYPAGTMLRVYEWDSGKYLGEIPQAAQTYKVIGNMNEHQVTIGETTFTGREELIDPNALVDYGSLIYIALQRSKTAREAIKIMAELVEKHGYYSSGESFSIADTKEVWTLEMISKGADNKGAVWVAVLIPDGSVSAHANHARITYFPTTGKNTISSENLDKIFDPAVTFVYAKDVISFAKEKGYFTGEDKDFSFSDTYNPLDFGGQRFCEARVWSIFRRINNDMEQYQNYAMGLAHNRMPLYVTPNHKLTVHEIMELMRDHYEGTPMDMTTDVGSGEYQCPYRWRPMTWEFNGQNYFNERAISTQQTAFSFVSQARSNMPNAIGGILWFGVDDTYSTVYVPMYMGMTEMPYNWKVGTGDYNTFTWESAFWVFNFVTNYTYSRYADMIKDVQIVQRELEGRFFSDQASVEQAAMEIYNRSPRQAQEYLTEYSNTQAAMVVERWKKLGEFLIFKYLDGNVKDEYNKATFPGYPAQTYDRIIKETGNRYLMPEGGGH